MRALDGAGLTEVSLVFVTVIFNREKSFPNEACRGVKAEKNSPNSPGQNPGPQAECWAAGVSSAVGEGLGAGWAAGCAHLPGWQVKSTPALGRWGHGALLFQDTDRRDPLSVGRGLACLLGVCFCPNAPYMSVWLLQAGATALPGLLLLGQSLGHFVAGGHC